MSGTNNDDNRAGSADSEHSSDSFVQVSKDDSTALMSEQVDEPVPPAEPGFMDVGVPSIIASTDDQEDTEGAGEDTISAPTDKEVL